MGLEKMGLPPKPYEKGKDWTPDAPNCEGCDATFTFFNRKHHCRRCGGLFCNNCTLNRQYLRGQGDAPARVCEPCKKIEDAAKLERHTKSKTPRGVTKASTKDDGTEALLKHILSSDGKSQGDVDVESILARVADNDSDEYELASPTQENAPVSPARLHEQAQEEKKRYSALKKQGKDADALKAFKRAKELERQAEAREKEIRHQRRMSAGSSSQFLGQHSKTSPSRKDPGSPDTELSSFSRRKSELGDNLKKRRAASQDQVKEKVSASEKDDFLHDLKALGWSDKEIREADKKPVAKTEEQLLAELTAEVHPKLGQPATSTAPGATMSAQILAHRRQALVFKREGNMVEAKEELRKAKLLEKQAEEMALLGQAEGDDEASDDDDLVALMRGLEREEKLTGNAGKGGTSQSVPEDFSLFSSFVDDDGDAHVEVDDDDLRDPEMVAALRAMGWEEDAAGLERTSKPKASKSTRSTEPTLKEQILALKRKALGFKREGKIAEARAALGEAKMLEQQLEKQESLTTPSSTVQTPLQPPAQVSVPALDVNDDKVEESEEVVEVTEEDMHDPEMMAQLRAMGFGDESTSSHETVTVVTKDNSVKKAALNQEILGLKRQALALKREGHTDEAREVLRRAKVLEQQLQDLQAVSQRQEDASALIKESRAIRRGVQPPLVLSEALSLDDEGEEEDVEVDNADLVDPAIAAALAAMGWQDDPTDQPSELPAIASKDDEPNRRAAVVPDLVPESLKPVGESQPQKVESMKSDVKAIEPKETEPTRNASAEVLSVPATSNHMYSNKTKSQLQQELLGRKRRALALKREGKSDEARIELQEAKIIEQKIAELDKGPAAIPLTVAEPKLPAASVQNSKQDLESAPPVYFDDLPVDVVEVTDDDMQDPALLAALASVGWQGDAEVKVPSKSTPILKNSETGEKEPVEGNVKSSGIKAQTGKGVEKLEMVLESDWGVPRKKTSKGTISKGTNKEKFDNSQDEGETLLEGEYGEIGQTLDLVPPILNHTGPKDSAAPSQQHNFWFTDLLTGNRSKSNESKEQADHVILPPLTQSIPNPPERVPSSSPSAKPAEVSVTKAAVSPQPATLNLQQEILAHKRKALVLKREGKAAEAREELRKAKLLEKQAVQHESEPTVLRSALTSAGTGDASARNNAEAVSVSTTVTPARIEPSNPVKTSSPAKVSDHKGEMQKQVRQTKDRMKLQQESLAHKRKAMGLRREGKIDEADAEYELAKNLEKQMEDLDPMHGKDLGDVAGVDDLLDPQLLAALKGVGFKEGELAGVSGPKGPVNPPAAVTGQTRSEVGSSSRASLGGAVAASKVAGGAVETEKKQLEEQIRAQKLQAVQLKRAGKQGEALEKLRASKLLEKRLLALTS